MTSEKARAKKERGIEREEKLMTRKSKKTLRVEKVKAAKT